MKLRIIGGELIVEVIDGDFAKPITGSIEFSSEPKTEQKESSVTSMSDKRNTIPVSLARLDKSIKVPDVQKMLSKIYYDTPDSPPTKEERAGQKFMPKLNVKSKLPI